MPPPPPPGDEGGGDDDDKPELRLASLNEASETVGKTVEGVSDLSRRANFEFRKAFGIDGTLVLGVLSVGAIVFGWVLPQTDLRFYMGV